jgi:hypothetical protein
MRRLVLQQRDVGERIAVDQQQVGEDSPPSPAQLVAAHHHLAAELSRRRIASIGLKPRYFTKYSRSFALLPCAVHAKP